MDPVKIFYSYAHEDEDQLKKLRNHLADLRRRGLISDWHDRRIQAGDEWKDKIDDNIRTAQLIIFLVSDDLMGSDYVNEVEVKLALERHEAKQARVIPVILSPVVWESSVFGGFQALPTDGKPVSRWSDPDEAFVDIVLGIQEALKKFQPEEPPQVTERPPKAAEAAPQAVPQVQPDAGDPRPPHKRKVTRTLLAVAAACAALLIVLYQWPTIRRAWDLSWTKDDRVSMAKPPRPGLAVLPLRNLSSDQAFAESMTETLISCIASELQGVRVISRQSVNRYEKSDRPLPEIAEELGVQMIVQGYVTNNAGNHSRALVASQLSRATPEELLWLYSQNVDLRDSLGAQCQVAEAISKGIRTKLGISGGSKSEPERRCEPCQASVNPEAYEAYVRGRIALNRRSSIGSLPSAITYLRKALEHDAEYAPAHASLANAYSLSGYYGLLGDGQTSPREYLEKARAHAEKALGIDPRLADAYTSLGIVQLLADRDWAKADGSFRHAIALNQNYADAYYFYWFSLFSEGRREQAAEKIGQAYVLDPLNPSINMNLGLHAMLDGDYKRALELIQEAKRLEPAYPGSELYLSMLYRRQGNEDLDFQHFWEFLELRYPGIVPKIEISQEPGGRQAALEAAARELELLWKQRIIPPEDVARVYLRLGQSDKVLDWLELSWERGFPAVLLFGVSGEWDGLRSDPRFTALLSKIRGDRGATDPKPEA